MLSFCCFKITDLFQRKTSHETMGLYLGGLIIGRTLASEIWGRGLIYGRDFSLGGGGAYYWNFTVGYSAAQFDSAVNLVEMKYYSENGKSTACNIFNYT